MSQSSQSILDHTAEMLQFISNTQSFWFTLESSYNHGCHLANRFHLELNDYKVLLVVDGLAHYTRFGFAMKPTAWSKFLGGHRFASDDCEIKLNINPFPPPAPKKNWGFYQKMVLARLPPTYGSGESVPKTILYILATSRTHIQ